MTEKYDHPSPSRNDDCQVVTWTEYPSVSLAAVDAIAGATDRDPTEFEPLQRSVDTEALESVFPDDPDAGDSAVRVSFTHADVRVEVSGDGTVVAQPTDR